MEHSIFCRVPEGHPIVARAIHRWGGQCTIIESRRDDRNVTAAAALRSSLWDSPNRCCPGFPVVNYWAIIESPSGTKNIACSVPPWFDLVSRSYSKDYTKRSINAWRLTDSGPSISVPSSTRGDRNRWPRIGEPPGVNASFRIILRV